MSNILETKFVEGLNLENAIQKKAGEIFFHGKEAVKYWLYVNEEDSVPSGHVIYEEAHSLPEQKSFAIGKIHEQFDLTKTTEADMWKAFLADDRSKAGGMLEQFISLSWVGIEQRKAIFDMLAAEGIVADPPYTKIKDLLVDWQTEVKAPN